MPGLLGDHECERLMVARMGKTLFFGVLVYGERFWGCV